VKVLFDQGTPVPLCYHLPGHEISTAYEMGWSRLQNGDLLIAAEASFDVLITTDQNLRYQQNVSGRKISILVLPTTSWPKLQKRTEEILVLLDKLKPGDDLELPSG
jgi:hypothetical protein